MLILLPTSTEKEHASTQMVGFVLLGIGGLALIGAMFMEIRDWPITRLEHSYSRRARNAIRAGRALPIPALPPRDVMATQHALRHVQAFAHELMAVPWGERVTVSSVELRPLFDQTVASVLRAQVGASRGAHHRLPALAADRKRRSLAVAQPLHRAPQREALPGGAGQQPARPRADVVRGRR